MTSQFVNIHTHRPTGRGIELRTAGIHPWDADKEDIAALGTLPADVPVSYTHLTLPTP